MTLHGLIKHWMFLFLNFFFIFLMLKHSMIHHFRDIQQHYMFLHRSFQHKPQKIKASVGDDRLKSSHDLCHFIKLSIFMFLLLIDGEMINE